MVIFAAIIAHFIVVQWLFHTTDSESILTLIDKEFLCSYVVLIGLVGLADDFKQGIPPISRVALLFAIGIIGFSMNPDWLPDRYSWAELLGVSYQGHWFAIFCASFILVGFTNAGNMVDGANGLLASLSLVFFLASFKLTSDFFYLVVCSALFLFFIVNIFTSKVILGDFGAYGLSALIVLLSFEILRKL